MPAFFLCIEFKTAQLRSELRSEWQAAIIEASHCAKTVVTFLMFQLSIQIKSSGVNVHEEAYGMQINSRRLMLNKLLLSLF